MVAGYLMDTFHIWNGGKQIFHLIKEDKTHYTSFADRQSLLGLPRGISLSNQSDKIDAVVLSSPCSLASDKSKIPR
jgi:hypothetical protein